MKRLVLAISIVVCSGVAAMVACTDVDQYPVAPTENTPQLVGASQGSPTPPTAPDAQICGSGSDMGGNGCGNSLPDGGLPDGGAFSMDAAGQGKGFP